MKQYKFYFLLCALFFTTGRFYADASLLSFPLFDDKDFAKYYLIKHLSAMHGENDFMSKTIGDLFIRLHRREMLQKEPIGFKYAWFAYGPEVPSHLYQIEKNRNLDEYFPFIMSSLGLIAGRDYDDSKQTHTIYELKPGIFDVDDID